MTSSSVESTTTVSSHSQTSRDASVRPAFVRLQTARAFGMLASANYWKTYVPKSLHNMPGLASALNDVLAHPDIHLRLPTSVLASKLLAHANEFVRLLAAEKPFKIGLTRSPLHMWENPSYGYRLEGRWGSMYVISILHHGESAGIMEACLISTWGSHHGCANEAEGGESVSQEPGPWFIYAVQGH